MLCPLESFGSPTAVVGVLVSALLLLSAFIVVNLSSKQKMSTYHLSYLPSTIPIVGNTLELAHNMDRYHEWLTSHSVKRDGKPFALHLLGKNDVLYVSRPEHFEEIVKTQNSNFIKSDSIRDIFDDFLNENIVLINGERWQFHRKILANLMSTRALREYMTPIIQEKVSHLRTVLKQASQDKQTVDIYKITRQFTLDTFAEIGFGIKLNLLASGKDHTFEVAFDDANRISSERFTKPTWLWKFQRYLNVSNERRLREAIDKMNGFIVNLIQDAMKQLEIQKATDTEDQPTFKSIMTILLNGRENITPTEVRNIALTGLGVGRNTTADTLVWLFHLVSLTPRVEQKLRAEILTEVPGFKDLDGYVPSYEDVQDLPYLEATILEVLRLCPTVPVIPYHCAQDTVLQDNTFIPAGIDIFLHLYAAGRLTSVWGPDATSFNPERFIDDQTGKLLKDLSAKYSSFSSGPRVCLGKNLAMLEMKMTIATIFSQFSLTEEPGQDVRPILDITLTMKNALMMQVSAIN